MSEIQKKSNFSNILAIVSLLIVILVFSAMCADRNDRRAKEKERAARIYMAEVKRIDSLRNDAISLSNLTPYGELYEIFKFGSLFTDVQRENKSREIRGSLVQWRLPVYEVAREKEFYRIRTLSRRIDGKIPADTIVEVYPKNFNERTFIESLKTGDSVTIRGYIDGVSYGRSIIIRPAVLIQ
jgi:hypothetical protein